MILKRVNNVTNTKNRVMLNIDRFHTFSSYLKFTLKANCRIEK